MASGNDTSLSVRAPRSLRPKNATALIVALGMLTVLALLAATFAILAQSERRISQNYVDAVRARMLALSGVEYAVARLRDPSAVSRILYEGEDWNGDGANGPVPANGQSESWNGNGDGVLDREQCAPVFALRPSLFDDRDGDGLPDLLLVREGGTARYRAYSGLQPGTHRGDGDYYVLRILDTSAQIYLNDENPNLESILNALGAELGLAGNIGSRILAGRGAGYGTKAVLVAPGILTRQEYSVLAPYVTTEAWVDPYVLRPRPQTDLYETTNSANGSYRPTVTSTTYPPLAYDMAYDLEPRAPVNVNRAPRPILTALLVGLSAQALRYEPNGFQMMTSNYLESYRSDTIEPISLAKARAAADEILAYRGGSSSILHRGANETGPFGTWPEFYAFVEQRLVLPGILTQDEGDLVCANANPNSLLNKFNPDAVVWRAVDKSDLLYHTQEFCFGPMGYFEITSVGRVLGPTGQVVGETQVVAVVRAYEVLRHTTQRDFMNASVTAATRRVAYFHENPGDRSFGTLRDGPESDFDGSISIAPVYTGASQLWYAQYWSTFGANNGAYPQLAQNPAAYMSKEGTSMYGVAPEISDLFHDGAYQAGDRYRHLDYGSIVRPFSSGSIQFFYKPVTDLADNQMRGLFDTTDVWRRSVSPIPVSTVQFSSQWNRLGETSINYPPINDCAGHGMQLYTAALEGNGDSRLYFDLGFQPAFNGNLITAPRTTSPTLANAFLRYSMDRPDFLAHQWYHVQIDWREETQDIDLDGIFETFTDGAVYLDGVPITGPGNRSAYAGQLVGNTVYVPPAYIQSGSLWFSLNLYRYFGNIMKVGNWFAPLTGQASAGNTNLDLFGEGTVDEVRISSVEAGGGFPPPDHYFPAGGLAAPRFYGEFGGVGRSNGASPRPDWLQLPLKSFPLGEKSGANLSARLLTVAYTAWRPAYNYDGVELDEAQRPGFDFGFRNGLGSSYVAALPPSQWTPSESIVPDSWDGREMPFAQLLALGAGATVTIAPTDTLRYRVVPTDGGLFPLRVSAFFDDITVTYVTDESVQYRLFYFEME